MPQNWERLASMVESDHRIFLLRRDVAVSPRTGAELEFVVIESRDWVAVIALTIDGRLVLVRQYRHGAGEVTVEIPGGMVDPGMSPEEAGRAELRQETGYAGGEWSELGHLSVVPAVFTNHLHVYLARGVELVGELQLDEGEDIVTEVVSLAEAKRMVASGEIVHAQVVAALYLYDLWVERQAAGGGPSVPTARDDGSPPPPERGDG
jgi:8-oxo-dGTP pyrophosphatase MutT (NUDIX family)